VEKIVLEVDEDLKGLELPLKALVAEAERRLSDARQGRRVDYELFEQRLGERLGEVERTVHAATLGALDVDAEHVLINDKLHARVGRNPAEYECQAGPVVVTRSLYRPLGERNAPTVDLVTLRSGAIADGWLPGTARAMAHLLQQGTSREAKQTAERLGRLPYSRSSFERVGHEVGELFADKRVPIEETLIRAFEVPKEAKSISVSLDRVSLPMEEPKPRPPGRPKKGAPKRSVQRVFRMAYCGTLTLHDENGEALHTIRYGCMPQADEKALVTSIASDALALRRKEPSLAVMALADGSPENWALLGDALDEKSFGEVHWLIDFWHVLEKLAAAAKVVHGEQESSGVVRRWKFRLLNSNNAAAEILEELTASGTERVRVGDNQPVHEAMTYLENNAPRMKYATARYLGLPIGSGAVEATCKSLVGVRMKRPGSRWKHTTGEHVIQLRALSLSDRWDQAMDLTLRPNPTYARPA
jgi:hypothetical protein